MKQILKKPLALLAVAVFLYIISFLFTTTHSRKVSLEKEVKNLSAYLHKQETDFLQLLTDTAMIQKLAGEEESLEEFRDFEKLPYGFYLYRVTADSSYKLVFWSSQMTTPSADSYELEDGEYFQKQPNGYYLCVKKKLYLPAQPEAVIAYAMIPVQFEYFVETDYLPNRFAHHAKSDRKIFISNRETAFPIQGLTGEILFYIEKKDYSSIPQTPLGIVWIRSVAVLLLLIFVYFMAEYTCTRQGVWKGIGVLVIALVLLRILTYYSDFPFNLRQFGLFDPAVYGANQIQKSLGDLMINAVLFCWVVLFAWSKLEAGQEKITGTGSRVPRWIGVLLAAFMVLFTFITANIIRSLAADSNISFDVTDFFSLTQYSFFGFVVLALISISYYYFTRILSGVISRAFPVHPLVSYFVIAVTGLTYLSFNLGIPQVRFFIFVLLWLVAYTWLLKHPGFFVRRLRFNVAHSLFWIFIFSVSISFVIIGANRNKEWEIRKRMAEKLDEQSDPYNERQLSISFTYIDNDFLEDNFDRFRDEEINKHLRDSIISQSGYLNKYDSRLYLFDAQGRGIFNEDAESFNALNTILKVQAKPTSTPQLYYYETSFDRFTFILKREVTDTSNRYIGSLFIVSKPKNYSADALYPELFRQANQNNPEESPVYAYAVYRDNSLISPFNKYPFPIFLSGAQIPSEEFEKRINNEYDELWYRASGSKVVVIAKKRGSVIEAITLFSYVFCSFLFLVAVLGLSVFILKAIYDISQIRKMLQLNIRIQVHSTIIFISLLSFVIIGFATISFFKTRYRSNNIDKLSRTMGIMVREMQKKLDRQGMFDDILPVYDSAANLEVQNLVNEVSEIHNVDVNVYDTRGNLHVSSQPLIYNEGFLSFKMQPAAFYHLNRLRQVQYVQEEKMATFSYQSIYAPVRDNHGEVKLYLNIPYFLSQRELNQEISNFLVTIINLNAFIFLIAGVIALFITNRITRSFSLISEKMKAVNLGSANEEIDWNRNDEIGELVKEYNKMVNKLEDSAAALARSEREGAWREMARQVAHEIKNPLTPMKLSIQYLQKSIDSNAGNVKELMANVAKTLVEQIDHLSKIAFDFSQFANIGNTNIETFDINEVIRSLGDLYQAHQEVNLELNILPDQVMVRADRTQMNRLFTNLIQNAIEACQGKDKCLIELDEILVDGMVRLSVKDNGEGIPAAMHSKIFVPNFTTKTSGTGLGLAMCKGIAEQAGGKIWFITTSGEGSIFFVELPLAG